MNTTRALRHAAAACALLALVAPALAANSDPVILVHGFAGFGRDELLGYKYWGGFNDLQEQLKARYSNQLVATAVVGPFSSNWDRETELFYQIKGGCVDYGALHSAANGHLEKPETFFHDGRTCYPGLYPAWDAAHPVHLVSHSMGGQTARMLVQMLAANGAPANPSLFPYAVDAKSARSVTTIALANDGTTLAYRVVDWVPFVQQLVTGIAGVSRADRRQRAVRLQVRPAGASARARRPRASLRMSTASPACRCGTRASGTWRPTTSSPPGAMAENDWVKEQPGVTYFLGHQRQLHRHPHRLVVPGRRHQRADRRVRRPRLHGQLRPRRAPDAAGRRQRLVAERRRRELDRAGGADLGDERGGLGLPACGWSRTSARAARRRPAPGTTRAR